MFVNKACQCCNVGSREKAILYFNGSTSIWFVCSPCSVTGKFISGKDVTSKYDLSETLLRDIKDNKEHGIDLFRKSFLFKSKTSSIVYVTIPGSGGYSTLKAINCETGEIAELDLDTPIVVLKLDYRQLCNILQINNLLKI